MKKTIIFLLMLIISILFGGAVYAEEGDVDILVLDSNGLPVNTAIVGNNLTLDVNASNSGNEFIFDPRVFIYNIPGTTLNINPYKAAMTNDYITWYLNIPGTADEFFYYSAADDAWVWETDYIDEKTGLGSGWLPGEWAELQVEAQVTGPNITTEYAAFYDYNPIDPPSSEFLDDDAYSYTAVNPPPHNDTNTTNRTYNGTCSKPCCTPTCGAMVTMQPTGLEAVMGALALLFILGGSILTRY